MFRNVQRRLFSFFNSQTEELSDFIHNSNLNSLNRKPPGGVSPKPWNSLPLRRKSDVSTPLSETDLNEIEEVFAAINSSLGAHLAQREKSKQKHHQQHQQMECSQYPLPEKHHYYSRMESMEFDCSTPKARGLQYGGSI